jgi:tripartite-type tricarboxylate transporter receptor subunit TctC
LRRRYRVATLRWLVSAYAAALVLSWAQAGAAQDTIDRPVTIYVAGTAGGGIDLYARLVGRHIGRHIPGKPTVTVQLMPGAGGIRAANYLAEQAPRDGTAMTTFASGPILEPLIGARSPGYDMSSFTWIGAITKDIGLCISWGPTPFKTIDDVKKQQMVVAGTGAGSETDTWPIVLNDVLGTKFKLVTGYVGSQETILAIERGEAHGRCVFSLSALKIAKPDWLRDNKINVLVLTALEKSAEFPGVPTAVDLVTKQEDRQLLEVVVAPHQRRRCADFIAVSAKRCSPKSAVGSTWGAARSQPRRRAAGAPGIHTALAAIARTGARPAGRRGAFYTQSRLGTHPGSADVVGEPALRLSRDFTVALERQRPRRQAGPLSTALVVPLLIDAPRRVVAAVTASGPAVDRTAVLSR